MRDVIRGIMGGLLTAALFFGPAASLYAAAGDVGARGADGADGVIHIWADRGDDAGDKWKIEAEATGNDFTINNGSTEVFNLQSNGVVTLTEEVVLSGGQSTLKDGSLVAAQTATNGYPATLSGVVVRLSATGGANNGTNTITLSNLAHGEAGNLFLLVNTGTSNNLAIAKTGTWKSDALELVENDSAWVVAITSNSFYSAGQ